MEEPPDSAGQCLSHEGSKEELVQAGRQGRESQARGLWEGRLEGQERQGPAEEAGELRREWRSI